MTSTSMRYLGCLGCLTLVLCARPVLAWSDHASLAWPLVRGMPALMDRWVAAEPLQEFVAAETQGLVKLLDTHERWALANIANYPSRPEALRFTGSEPEQVAAFLAAIRVNPTLSYPLYRQLTVEDDAAAGSDGKQLQFADLSFLAPGLSHQTIAYVALAPGQPVRAAHVVATASDEPDFGLDIGLFTDNDTAFGREYGFGPQPFGNPNLDYGSQAPFHMGFYHLDWLTRVAQPQLLQTYPAWRIALYQQLAAFAFEHGHPYWGWRFSGWALHYIGDLTQPYHAQPLPGVSTPEALWLVLRGKTADAIQLVSNRHGVLESYQYQQLMGDLSTGQWSAPLLQAVANPRQVPAFDWSLIATDLTASSVAAGDALDAALEALMPAQLVSDPDFEWVGSGLEATIVERLQADKGTAATDAMDQVLISQLDRFSRFARSWLDWAESMQRANGEKFSRSDGNATIDP